MCKVYQRQLGELITYMYWHTDQDIGTIRAGSGLDLTRPKARPEGVFGDPAATRTFFGGPEVDRGKKWTRAKYLGPEVDPSKLFRTRPIPICTSNCCDTLCYSFNFLKDLFFSWNI